MKENKFLDSDQEKLEILESYDYDFPLFVKKVNACEIDLGSYYGVDVYSHEPITEGSSKVMHTVMDTEDGRGFSVGGIDTLADVVFLNLVLDIGKVIEGDGIFVCTEDLCKRAFASCVDLSRKGI